MDINKTPTTPTTYHILTRRRLYFSLKPEDCGSEIIHVTTCEEDMSQFLKDHNISPADPDKWSGEISDDGDMLWYHLGVYEQGRYAHQ